MNKPRLNAEVLLAMQETEQILNDYSNGTRTSKSFSNASEMFAAIDEEDDSSLGL